MWLEGGVIRQPMLRLSVNKIKIKGAPKMFGCAFDFYLYAM